MGKINPTVFGCLRFHYPDGIQHGTDKSEIRSLMQYMRFINNVLHFYGIRMLVNS
jgi:hypothetical protein